MQPGSARILVVDDNDDNRYALTLYLELEGYTDVAIAEDGEQAIARLDSESFDLVLLDVMMPKVDGYQVLRWAKDQPRLRDLPIIMISALNEIDSVVKCIELGAVDYLLKPFNQVLLRARLAASLEKKRLRDQIDAQHRRVQAELDAARKLQLGMVPHVFPPPTPDCPLDVFARMEPAREVGGDLYDFFRLADGTFCFLIGDVAGKGMPAALVMSRTKSLMRTVAELMAVSAGADLAAADVVARVNRDLCENNADMMFVTLFFGMLNPTTGELRYCSAGHNAPYHLKGEAVEAVEEPKGVILGVKASARYQTGRLTLAPGEAIFLFTDGVTEANDASGALFGEERLEATLRGAHGQPAGNVIARVTQAVAGFVGKAEPFDDIAMLVVRRVAG